ncbi:Uncharacterised protein [Mycobacterium tuberculosis]|nr:Uncharacterised protein [Mycobacterium tuberculosis]
MRDRGLENTSLRAWMVPGELAIFGLDELDRAKEWAAG